MGNPSIQNDFSYYRRTVSRMKMGNNQGNIVVNDELANRMSLFFAHSNPLSKALIDSLTNAISMVGRACSLQRKLNGTRVVECFGILAGVSYNTIVRQK
ncbi:Protein fam49a [Kappamyces sp. JEL0680]|nr:Protein fam49a [Kappamyces sp. JEL0680]